MGKKIKCWLKSEWKQCCCNCRWHVKDCYHCTTDMDLRKQIEEKTGKSVCICNIQKGWACIAPFEDEPGPQRVHTNWPEHSLGCELYSGKVKP